MMAKRYLALLAASAIIAFVAHCGNNGGGSTNPAAKEDPSFAGDIQPIFSRSCALSSCHAAPGQLGLVLSTGQSYAGLVDVAAAQEPTMKRVAPFAPEESYLITKLEGRQAEGQRMPPALPLSSSEIQLMRNWITKGAKDN
jgi:hypothetical protein